MFTWKEREGTAVTSDELAFDDDAACGSDPGDKDPDVLGDNHNHTRPCRRHADQASLRFVPILLEYFLV
jgi:hypothetical protein